MQKLWQKDNYQLDELVERFETGDDLLFDEQLLPYDIYGTLAHIQGLTKLNILSTEELEKVTSSMQKLMKLSKKGPLLKMGDEDCHTKIEQYITEQHGAIGKKIHTGRSRNDQVLTALRLYSKDQLLNIWQESLKTASAFLDFAKKYENDPMPGFTHLQKAMPTTVGMWASSFTESFLDDMKLLNTAVELNNRSPLGSGAGFGVPLALDREYTAGLLGFSSPIINPMYCQLSRGKVEAATVMALQSLLGTVNKFATDVLIYTSQEFSYVSIDDKLCTGSSIMPQKKNIDIAELLRAKSHIVQGNLQQIIGLGSNLPSGYNRDMQDSKKPLMESLSMTLMSLQVTGILIKGITPNLERLAKAVSPDMLAAHKALELVANGTPFREAYKIIGNNLGAIEASDLPHVQSLSTHIGGTANLQLNQFDKFIEQNQSSQTNLVQNHQSALTKLLKKEK